MERVCALCICRTIFGVQRKSEKSGSVLDLRWGGGEEDHIGFQVGLVKGRKGCWLKSQIEEKFSTFWYVCKPVNWEHKSCQSSPLVEYCKCDQCLFIGYWYHRAPVSVVFFFNFNLIKRLQRVQRFNLPPLHQEKKWRQAINLCCKIFYFQYFILSSAQI